MYANFPIRNKQSFSVSPFTIHRIDRITHIINWKEALAPRLAAPVALDGCVEHHRHHGEKGESPTDQNYPKTADMETALDNC